MASLHVTTFENVLHVLCSLLRLPHFYTWQCQSDLGLQGELPVHAGILHNTAYSPRQVCC